MQHAVVDVRCACWGVSLGRYDPTWGLGSKITKRAIGCKRMTVELIPLDAIPKFDHGVRLTHDTVRERHVVLLNLWLTPLLLVLLLLVLGISRQSCWVPLGPPSVFVKSFWKTRKLISKMRHIFLTSRSKAILSIKTCASATPPARTLRFLKT